MIQYNEVDQFEQFGRSQFSNILLKRYIDEQEKQLNQLRLKISELSKEVEELKPPNAGVTKVKK